MEATIEKTNSKQIYIALSVVLVLTLLTQLVDNAFTMITPVLINNFHISTNVASWVSSLGGIGLAIGFLSFSSFSDFFSEKKLIIVGLALFILPSILGLLFQQFYYVVLVARFIQAIGGISTSAMYLVLIARYLPVEQKIIWMGFATTSFKLSTVVGTLAGGFLTEKFGWQVIFYIPMIALLAVPLLLKNLPNNPKKNGKIELLGFVLLSLVAICINFLASKPNMLLLGVTILAVLLFLVYVAKSKNPVVTMDMLKNKRYMFTLLAALFYYLAQVAIVFLLPFLLQGLFGLNIASVSLSYVIPYVASAAVAAISGNIIKKLGQVKTLLIGGSLIIVGFFLMAVFAQYGLVMVQIFLTLIVCGYSLSFSPFLNQSISSLEEKQVGTGIGIFNFVVRISCAVGISISAFIINSKAGTVQLFSFVPQSMSRFTVVFLTLLVLTFIGTVLYLLLNKKTENK